MILYLKTPLFQDQDMLDRFLKGLLRYRFFAILILLLSILFFGYFITRIRVDNDTFKAIPPSLKARIDYDNLKKEFNAPYNILFLAEFKAGSLTEKIDSIHSWAKDFGVLEGIGGIADLNSVQIPVKGGFFGMSSDFLVSKKKSLTEEQIRERIKDNREFSGLFISEDESIFGMIIGLQADADRSVILGKILSKTEQINRNPYIETFITSEGAISYFIDKAMKRDFSILLPICFAIVFLLLYRVFRKTLYVWAALSVNVVALIWTFGLIGMMKVPFSVVTSIIPVILFPIGVADAIHILKTYAKNRQIQKGNIQRSLHATYAEQIVPCLLTSMTTFAGFSSFGFSEISWTRTFGIFTGIAVVFAYIFNIVLLPLFLSFEKSSNEQRSENIEERYLDRFWDSFARFIFNTKRWAFVIPVLAVIFAIGFRMVHVESNPIEMLPEDNMLRISDEFIGKHFGGTRFFSVVLKSKETKLSKQEQWETVQEIISFIEKEEGVGSVSSIVPLLTRVSTMLSGERFSNAAISMLTSTKGFFGKNYQNYIDGFLSEDRHKTRLTVTCSNGSGVHPLMIGESIERHVKEKFPGWDALVSGPAILNEAMSSVLIRTQISSLISTFIPVFLCLILFFRSFRVGLFSIIPIILSTGFVYALMGIMGVSINLVTVIIMNTCIGIGIDYAIHFVSGYLYYYKRTGNRLEALKTAIKNKGTPILFNTLVVGIGFLVLAFSSFPPIRDFGILVFVSMIISAAFSILFLSILISQFGMGDSMAVRKELS